jgi:hypothetical protein
MAPEPRPPLGRAGRLGLTLLLTAAAALACGRAEEPSGPGATGPVAVPEGLSIRVEIDGEAQPALDGTRLEALPGRTEGGGRRVWLLSDVLGDASAEKDRRLEVSTADGQRVVFKDPSGSGVLALVVNRRGEVLVASVDPGEDDDRHGRGGNRGRGGAGEVRLRGVTGLRLFRAGDGGGKTGPAASADAPRASVRISVDGEDREAWTLEALRSSPTIARPIARGAGEAPPWAWSLRELVAERIGTDAMVVRLIGEGGRAVDVDPTAFASAPAVPVLRLNRRGQFRFEWWVPEAAPGAGPGLRDVRAIQIRSGG